MTTLITGGTGFIGAEIARILISNGEGPIHVAQRSSDLGRLSDLADQIELHHLDLSDPAEIDAVIGDVKPSRIFHFGAILTGPGEQDPKLCSRQTPSASFTSSKRQGRPEPNSSSLPQASAPMAETWSAGDEIDDLTLQRPTSVYGVTKVLGENLGAYYRDKYGLDFRSLRYPAIVGPGVTTWSLAQYTSWMIERPAQGEAFSVWVEPESVIALMWYQDAARAAVELAAAPMESITSINYLVDGAKPTPTAGALADAVRLRIPDAQISFDPPEDSPGPRDIRLDDRAARQEWGWEPRFDTDAMIDGIIAAQTEG